MKVCVVIPAHNEGKNIREAVMDMLRQTYKVFKVVVVDDRSTDNTADVVRSMAREYPEVVLVQTHKPQFRAGAINAGIEYIKRHLECDFVLAADADSRFDKHLIAEGIKAFGISPKIGGVCSIAGVSDPKFHSEDGILKNIQKWILWRLQRLEYAGFDATRTSTWRNVLILHGLCSMFRFEALVQAGGYTPNHLLEDYKLTLQLKKNGWETKFNPKMIAETKVPETLWALLRQRLRWMRGGIQIIVEEGITKYTWEDAGNHLLFLAMLVFVIVHTALLSTSGWHINFSASPLPIALAVVGYLYSLYNLRYVRRIDIVDILIRILILPELILAMIYSVLQMVAYSMSLLKLKQLW